MLLGQAPDWHKYNHHSPHSGEVVASLNFIDYSEGADEGMGVNIDAIALFLSQYSVDIGSKKNRKRGKTAGKLFRFIGQVSC